jgi:hypothetical protein
MKSIPESVIDEKLVRSRFTRAKEGFDFLEARNPNEFP